ncbi:MAG TPA: hypothetical protein VMH20_19645 [Verrucomicrobiae bacterium]|nr:hypothetical protein [Verrucomicrobiae bacterium]
MMHLSEEQLIAYREGETRNRESFAAHLKNCDGCRRELERIEAVFAALDAMPIPDPGEDFGRRVWQQISPRLAEKRERWWDPFFEPHRLLAFGGVAALVLLAFFIGRYTRTNAIPPSIADTGKTNERVLVVAVGEHLGRSEMVLMELANAEPEKGQKLMNISAEQKRAEDLLEENRLYRQTALRHGDTVMASTLDELERVLLDIANSPDQVTPGQFEAIQKRIAAKGILLKVRVVDQQLRQQRGNVEEAPQVNATPVAGNKI